MAIEKTPTGKYRVRVKLSTGKWLTKTCPSLQLAKKVELGFQSRKILGDTLGIHPAPYLSEVWKEYSKFAKVNKRSWSDDETRYRLHIEPKLGSLKMSNITPGMIQNILDDKLKSYAPATQKQVLQMINRLFNYGIKQRLYRGENPCRSVSIPTFDNRQTECLSVDEIKRLLDVVEKDQNERAALVVKFALFAGKRRGEILRLKWDCVDFNSGTAQFLNTKNGSHHAVPLNQQALAVLRRAEELKISELVFPCSTGKYYWDFPATWRRLRKKAGFNYRFHALRHTFSSHLAQSGKVTMFELKELLNHKSLKMVERYAHLFPNHLRKATSVMDNLFK
jgi:integrase